MCCYCRDVHASWTVGDLNSTRRWHIYQHSVSGRDFCWLFWTAAPLPQVQIQNLGWALRLCLWFFLFPLLKGVTESPFIPMCCLSCASFSLLSPCSCFLCLLLCWPTRVAAFIWDWGRETRRRAASMNPLTSSSSSGMFGCPTPRSSQLSLRIQTPNIFYLPEDFFLAAPWALLLQSQILLRYFSYWVFPDERKQLVCLWAEQTAEWGELLCFETLSGFVLVPKLLLRTQCHLSLFIYLFIFYFALPWRSQRAAFWVCFFLNFISEGFSTSMQFILHKVLLE